MPDSKNLFMGLVQGATSATVSAAILDNRLKEIVAESFLLDEAPIGDYLVNTGHGTEFVQTPDLDQVAEFLTRHIPRSSSVGLLVETPTVLPFADQGDTPAAVFPANSVLFKFLCFLGFQGLGVTFAYYEVPERQRVVAHYVKAHPDKLSEAVPNQARFLTTGISSAYCALLFDVPLSPERSAGVAALIAKNHGSYYYWSSAGSPPSAGDIAYYLRRGEQRLLVGSGAETFSIRVRKIREGFEDALEDVVLEYALAQKQWAQIGDNDASKAALIHVSKTFNFDIRCYSNRADATERDPRLVYPLPAADDWISSKIKEIIPQSG
jgi:hypothetical protein